MQNRILAKGTEVFVWDKPKTCKGFNSAVKGVIIDCLRGGNLSCPHYTIELETKVAKRWVTRKYITT